MLDPRQFEDLTKETVLRNRTPLELFAYYVPQFVEPGKRFCSDLRKDNNPSCVIYERGLYVDYGTGKRYDIFSYLQEKYMCSFPEVLQIINNDFNLGLGDRPITAPVFFGIKERKEVELKWKEIPFSKEGLTYYGNGAITKEILEMYWHKQLEGFWVNGKYFNAKNQLCFLQPEIRKGSWVHKIYMPNNPKGRKFPASNDGGTIYGLRQLPDSGDLLFVTSSKKDIMALRGIGYYSISGTSESVNFTAELFDFLRPRFKKIIFLYNNDEQGRKKGEELSSTWGSPAIYIGLQHGKDPFELNTRYAGSWWRAKEVIEHGIRSIQTST